MQYYFGQEIISLTDLGDDRSEVITHAGRYIIYNEELTNQDHSPEKWNAVGL